MSRPQNSSIMYQESGSHNMAWIMRNIADQGSGPQQQMHFHSISLRCKSCQRNTYAHTCLTHGVRSLHNLHHGCRAGQRSAAGAQMGKATARISFTILMAGTQQMSLSRSGLEGPLQGWVPSTTTSARHSLGECVRANVTDMSSCFPADLHHETFLVSSFEQVLD